MIKTFNFHQLCFAVFASFNLAFGILNFKSSTGYNQLDECHHDHNSGNNNTWI